MATLSTNSIYSFLYGEEEVKVTGALSVPIVPEIDEQGNKRLWRKRYELLEDLYVTLHSCNQMTLRDKEGYRKAYEDAMSKLMEMKTELATAKAQHADSEEVVRKMNILNKDMKLGLNLKAGDISMKDKLDAFFGALFSRIRINEDADELAE